MNRHLVTRNAPACRITEPESRSQKRQERQRLRGLALARALLTITCLLISCYALAAPPSHGDGGISSPARTLSALSMEKLDKATFLVASRQLQDPNFRESVVLLVDYGRSGAMGVIVNRPTSLPVAGLLPDLELLRARAPQNMHFGGPVARGRLSLLVRTSQAPVEARHVFADVYVSGETATLEWLLERDAGSATFRAYAGYAGWGPGQLESELARGDWFVEAADAATVFETAPSVIWPELIRRNTGHWVCGLLCGFPGIAAAVTQSAGIAPEHSAQGVALSSQGAVRGR